MVVIIVNKKLLGVITTAIFIVFMGLGFYQSSSTSAFLASANVSPNIEIFNIGKGSIIKVLPVNDIALAEAKKILRGITGMYLKANAIPEKGYIIKIPFEPNIKVKSQWLAEYDILSIDKMYIVFPHEGTPYLLILDKKERPYLYNFKSDTDKLLKSLKFEID